MPPRAALLVLASLAACGSAPSNTVAPASFDGGGVIFRRAADAGDPTANRGSIAGQVTLFGAASSAGVQVTLQPYGLITLSSDSSGDFLLDDVSPGPFTLTLSAPGYGTAELSDALASGDAVFESVQLQRSVALAELDGGTLTWIGGPPPSSPADGGLSLMYGVGTDGLYAIDLDGPSAQLLISTDAGLNPVGVTPAGVGFFTVGSNDGGLIGIASQGMLTLVSAPEMLPESLTLSGERLFLALRPDAGGPRAWVSVGDGDLWPQPELDQILQSPPPVVFGRGLAGYRQQSPSCVQLMAFGESAFEALADCLPFEPVQLDSSTDGTRVTAVVSPTGNPNSAFFEIADSDGGKTVLDGALAAAYVQAVPVDAETLYLVDPSGGISIWTAPGTLLYATTTLGQTVRPGGSFLAALPGEDANGTTSSLVTNDGHTSMSFYSPWSSPIFSPDGRYAVFLGLPTLFDLVAATEYPLAVDPASAAFSGKSDALLLVGVDGTLVLVDLTGLPVAAQGASDGQPVGTFLEGTYVTAAAFSPNGASVIYVGIDPAGRSGLFIQPSSS